MRIIVLGGTSFVGRAIVDGALSGGHEVTLFSRGRTGAELFADIDKRRGDRDSGDYAGLAGGSWDACVDVSAYVPRHVTQAADALEGRVGRYLFISTGSVYDHRRSRDGMDEEAPRLAPERRSEKVTGETYGPLKVACEDDALARFGERTTIVRPGIVAGPHDPTDRFTYWVRRAARGGRVLVPGHPDQPVQVVDSCDLARLVLALLEGNVAGTYNAVGPKQPVTLARLIEICAAAADTSVEIAEVDQAKVGPGFPLVLGESDPYAIFRRSSARARAVGLTATPLQRTAADVGAWDRDRGRPQLSVGLSAEQEAALFVA